MTKKFTSSIALLSTVCLMASCTSDVDEEPAERPAVEESSDSSPPSADPAIAAIQKFIELTANTTRPGWKALLRKPPQQTFAEGKKYFWNLTTSEGPIKIELMPAVAPMHVTSTIYLTELDYYNGLVFHRVMPGFMAQGGCPLGNGRGGPGYQYAGEFDPAVRHDRPGLLSMANGGPNTDGSQFFITFDPAPHLDGKHTIFGEVVEGMDTVRKLEAAGSRSGTTTKVLLIEQASITVE